MSRIEEVKQNLSEKFPVGDFKFYYENDNDVVVIPKANILEVIRYYRENSFYDFLMDLTAVDYSKYPDAQEGRYAVVYHLFSSKTLNRLRIKVFLQEDDAKLPSLTSVWRSANWFEREAYDMYGIIFEGHPNLTKILTHHHFKGHPLRKDYDANNQQHCSDVLPVHFEDGSRFSPVPGKDLVPLNIGPSHPATHGTLRVMAALDGEKVEKAGVELGFLHRCFEKMAETHPYNQVIPYTDRLNYCSAPMNNIGYCKAVEKMLGVEIPLKAQAIRIILAELSRVIDHIVCIGANAVDLGALSGFFYLFKLREQVYTLFEKLCGARLTVSMTRVGGMAQDPPAGWYKDVLETCKSLRKGIDEVDRLLTENKIWMQRTQGVGSISAEDAIMWGYTGPCLRAAGVGLDLRKAEPYYGYESLDFEVPVGTTGDVYDRYLVRLEEMKQSVKIVEQVAKNIPAGDYTIRDKSIVLPEKKDVYGNIEGLMNHFMLIMKGIKPPKGEIYDYTEAANGELGFFLVSDGEMKPYRLRVRPPCFPIYQSFPEQITGGLVADVISVLGSMNLIAGELDR
ncbi:MAG: NADH dehydrogenase (quinone) subunit D [Bdellovibrionota bacterium]|nr:NADH dehydrogenase (quinone) subunit D [Bdellovibrionota bacterium]